MKKILLILVLFSMSFATFAQDSEEEKPEKDSPFSFSTYLQSNHYWRGLAITDVPVLSVYGGLRLDKSGAFNVGFWGASAFSQEREDYLGQQIMRHYQEINLYVSYEKKGFYIGLWDLFNTAPLARSKDLLDFEGRSTGHIIDLRTNYTLQGNTPLRFEFDVMLFGDDVPVGVSDEDNVLSSYLEFSYPFVDNSNVNLKGLIGSGFSLNGSGKHIYSTEESDFSIVNLGVVSTKSVKITENYAVGVTASFLLNPSSKFGRMELILQLF